AGLARHGDLRAGRPPRHRPRGAGREGGPRAAARRCSGRLRRHAADPAAVAVLGCRPRDPTGYGRLVLDGDELTAIREELDASAAERAIGLCNGGLMAFAGATALAILEQIGNENRKGEF